MNPAAQTVESPVATGPTGREPSRHAGWRLRLAVLALAVVMLGGCATVRSLMPTPLLYVTQGVEPFKEVPAGLQSADVDVLYVTDRKLEKDDKGNDHYGVGRSTSVAFGAAIVSLGEDASWDDLALTARRAVPSRPFNLTLRSFTELGRAPPTPMPWTMVDGVPVTEPGMLAENQAVGAALCDELERRLALTPRKEVFVYVHGIQNSFEDALFAMAELWHYLGREGVPVAYTWPAGGGGVLRGYTYDRESGEFTVFHLKQFINGMRYCPAVERISIIAHSRGTDVTVTALRELTIAERAAGHDPIRTLRIHNVVLASPDLDLGVTMQRASAERISASVGRLTIYTSPNDEAISFAELLFGGLVRLGQLDITREQEGDESLIRGASGSDNTSIITYEGTRSGSFGHSYFRENPSVSSDLILTLRYDRDPGAANGRPLEHTDGSFWQIDDDYFAVPPVR